mmetsp:Transcript_27231/g.71717  ORF Transcript_27231/g.71717 Transcript_27231/m.71717 type:complete len:210 (-) Transcript_27231:3-632(-)
MTSNEAARQLTKKNSCPTTYLWAVVEFLLSPLSTKEMTSAPAIVRIMLHPFCKVNLSMPKHALNATVITNWEGCHAAAEIGPASCTPLKMLNWSIKMNKPGTNRMNRPFGTESPSASRPATPLAPSGFLLFAMRSMKLRIGAAQASRIKAKSKGLIPTPESPSLLITAAEPQHNCVRKRATWTLGLTMASKSLREPTCVLPPSEECFVA